MNPRAFRILIPLLVGVLAVLVVASMIFAPPKKTPSSPTAATAPATPTTTAAALTAPTPAAMAPSTAPASSPTPVQGLHAAAPSAGSAGTSATASLGSIDPRDPATPGMRLDLSRRGAGIASIVFADQWDTAAAKRQALRHEKSRPPGAPLDVSKLDETRRSVLQTQQIIRWVGADGIPQAAQVPIMAAHSIIVNGATIPLLFDPALNDSPWSETAPGAFACTIVDDQQRDVLHITRQFVISRTYDITLTQTVRNVSSQPVEIKWRQYGVFELGADPTGYIDRRRVDMGYRPEPTRLPETVLANHSDIALERGTVHKRYEKSQDQGLTLAQREQHLRLWPNRASIAGAYDLSWIAVTNRYFAMAIHPATAPPGDATINRSLGDVIDQVRLDMANFDTPSELGMTFLHAPARTIPPGQETTLNMSVYAGPLDRHILAEPPYDALSLESLILYQMSSCCSFLTFQWLAHLLLGFLSLLHDYVFFDWGLAIIVLVCVVRTLLHPITKKSQVNMQRFGKQMSTLKPEIDKLQKKYPNDPKKFQQEQMRLMREHGINPLKMLGCVTLFLQTPIWIALWAMLYLAYDLRQQPAFYGVFQSFWNWSFLGDLSSPDHFIPLGRGVQLPLVGMFNSINLMPILLGVVFYVQQKYMTPPTATPLTPEQEQQQKIMKVMMVVLMPLMLYSAPSGLTLYMFTSSCIGIIESKYIRAHVKELELNPPKPGERENKKPRGSRARAWAEALERARERSRQRAAEAPRKFKDRK